MPKVSIIIPNYNHQDFLIQRIESVLNQTYTNFEVILLDDASVDDSVSVLERYRNHPKITQVILNTENSGSVFKQWIRGVQLAQGEYIWIAESDDYANEQFLESTLRFFETNTKLGMVFTDTLKVDEAGIELGLVSKSKKRLKYLADNGCVINKSNCTHYLLEKLVIVNASSVLFRKEALLNLNFDLLKRFKNAGDIFVYLGVVLHYDAYFLAEPLNYMRLHVHNTTKKYKQNGILYRDKILILDYYLKDFNQINVEKPPFINFLYGLIFLSIDYGHLKQLKKLLKKMYFYRFLDKKQFFVTKTVIFFYRCFTYRGRPQFIREGLKAILKKNILY